MRWPLVLAAVAVVGQGTGLAQRASSPADATVFVRLVGSMRAEFEEAGSARQTAERPRVEIGTGSGFVISPHGYILTNEHVVSNREFEVVDGPRKARISLKVSRVEVCFPADALRPPGPTRCVEASIHSVDAGLDLAVLFVSASNLPYVAMGDSDVARPGQPVSALGYPFGRQLEVGRVAAPDLVPEVSTSAGTISAVRGGDRGEPRALQINSTVNPGNSGGPLVDQDGFAVGVIRARVAGDAGIGFAVPINQVKDFLESRGLDSLMPARRLRLGAAYTSEAKAIALRLPEGMSDSSPLRARVETDPASTDIALRIDRSVSPWTVRQIEQTLTASEAFERIADATRESQTVARSGSVPVLIGRASGSVPGGDGQIRMQYGIVELGAEKLVARYVGAAESLAYNEGVLRDSLLSVTGRPLVAGALSPVPSIDWRTAPASGVPDLPLPANWVVEPGAPSSCAGLPQVSGFTSAFPVNDISVGLRASVWDDSDLDPQSAAGACSSRRGPSGATSYALRADWLGVSYVIEGVFIGLGTRRVAQLEVIAPNGKSAFARALLAAWTQAAGNGARGLGPR